MSLNTAATRLSVSYACLERTYQFLVNKELVDIRENPERFIPIPKELKTSTQRQRYEDSLLGVKLINASSKPLKDGRQVLKDVLIHCEPQTTTMVTGPAGCGKSELLKAMLGETQMFEGRIIADKKSICYCAQTPYLRNVSIQENIVRNSVFSDLWYEAVLRACGLLEDLAQLPDGDQTLAGVGGCNLSGGQKQRVALACAIFANKPILALDSIFTALDKTTARIIFRRLFGPQGLLTSAGARYTVIMVTNIAEHLQFADQILAMDENGQVERVTDINRSLNASYLQHESELADQDKPSESSRRGALDAPDAIGANLQQANNNNNDAIPDYRRADLSLYWYYMQSFGLIKVAVWILWTGIASIMERIPCMYLMRHLTCGIITSRSC